MSTSENVQSQQIFHSVIQGWGDAIAKSRAFGETVSGLQEETLARSASWIGEWVKLSGESVAASHRVAVAWQKAALDWMTPSKDKPEAR